MFEKQTLYLPLMNVHVAEYKINKSLIVTLSLGCEEMQQELHSLYIPSTTPEIESLLAKLRNQSKEFKQETF